MATSTHEQTINTAFAEVVEGVGRGWSIRAENVGGVFEGGGRPDVLIEKGDGWPIVIEAEVGNHHQAEVEAISRLNRRVASTGKEVHASVALVPQARRTIRVKHCERRWARRSSSTPFTRQRRSCPRSHCRSDNRSKAPIGETPRASRSSASEISLAVRARFSRRPINASGCYMKSGAGTLDDAAWPARPGCMCGSLDPAASHRDAAGAEHALIVARTFAGFGAARHQECAVLDECRSTGGVSIKELDAAERIHRSIAKYSYPLVQIKDVVCTLETPAQKISRIEGLETPARDLTIRRCWIKSGPGRTMRRQTIWSRIDPCSSSKDGGTPRTWSTLHAGRPVALETLAPGRIQLTRHRPPWVCVSRPR